MPPNVTTGAMLMCTFGMAPATLNVIRPTTLIGGKPAAIIQDSAPMVNIPPFGMCTSPSNPQVAAATAAALGVLTPMPCIPATSAPWIPPNPATSIGGTPVLTSDCQCICNWGGQITISFPGQVQTQTG
jgi:hypothetical protein